MSAQVLIAFIAACILLALTPGPNMSLIIANTLRGGLAAGFATLAGTTTGLALLVAAAALGMTSVMAFMSEWFDLIRWAGALYLVYLGARQLWLYRCGAGGGRLSLPSVRGAYAQGLFVSLSNPKVLLFLGAFLPQFVDPAADVVRQLAVLAVVFVLVLAAVDAVYTLAVARARITIDAARLGRLDVASGIMLLLGGLALAITRRP
ncbi:MAG: LysE family translocator [Hyphomicrobiaceae bacterium]|nr:MAG: LysE family translocator [Hyphomicrobiaceae bacterium]